MYHTKAGNANIIVAYLCRYQSKPLHVLLIESSITYFYLLLAHAITELLKIRIIINAISPFYGHGIPTHLDGNGC